MISKRTHARNKNVARGGRLLLLAALLAAILPQAAPTQAHGEAKIIGYG